MKRFVDAMEEKDLDVLLATVPENVFYVTDLPASPVSPNRLLNVVKNSSPTFAVINRNGGLALVTTRPAVELAREKSCAADIRTDSTGTYIVRPGAPIPKAVATDPLDAVAGVNNDHG